MVFDDKTGQPIGLVDGSHITGMRTGASGAIGAKYLAREDSETLLIVGTGHISRFEIAATLSAIPRLGSVIIHDPINHGNAVKLKDEMSRILEHEFSIGQSCEIIANESLENAVGMSDIIITATPSREAMIKKEWVQPGTHFSCIGADMPGKEEIDPNIFADARVFVDDLNQCMNIGEIEIPVKMGIIKPGDIIGEIGDILSGAVEGRTNNEQVTVFDATGTALLDLVTAQLAFKKSEEKKMGVLVTL